MLENRFRGFHFLFFDLPIPIDVFQINSNKYLKKDIIYIAENYIGKQKIYLMKKIIVI